MAHRRNESPAIDRFLDAAQFACPRSDRMVGRKKDTNMKIPKFKTETEEAEWLYAHRRQIEAELSKAKPLRHKTGALMTPAEIVEEYVTKTSKAINIRLPIRDIELAKSHADAKGIGYQTLIRMLLHEALRKTG